MRFSTSSTKDSKSGSLDAPPVFKGYDSVDCTLGGAVVTKL